MRIGVVGYGSIGRRHADNIKGLGHEVVIYDPQVIGMAVESKVYEGCEAVVIASPSKFHEEALRTCVERNKHVLVEKPIGLQIGAIPALLRAAEDKGLTVMMGNNLRFHPCIQQAKIWLAQNKLGDPLWANFTCAVEGGDPAGDGVILNVGSHEVDVAQYFFGPGKCMSAYVGRKSAFFVLLHDTGVRSTFFLDLATPYRIREFWIAGTEQNLGVDLDSRALVLGGETTQAPGSYDDDYRNEMAGFIDRINGRFAPGASGKDGLAALRTLLDVKLKASKI